MKTNQNLILLVLFSFSFIACEGNTERRFSVNNQSSGTVIVDFESEYAFSTSYSISSNSSTDIMMLDDFGGQSDPNSPAWYFTELYVVKGQDTCLKDYQNDANWTIKSEQKKKTPSRWVHEYTFTVSDSDF